MTLERQPESVHLDRADKRVATLVPCLARVTSQATKSANVPGCIGRCGLHEAHYIKHGQNNHHCATCGQQWPSVKRL